MQDSVDIRPLYMVAPDAGPAGQLVDDLLGADIPAEDVRLFAAATPNLALPEGVELSILHRRVDALWRGLVVGAGLGLIVALVTWAVGMAGLPALLAVLAGAVAGPAVALVLSRRRRAGLLGPLERLVDGGEIVVRVRIPKARLQELEDRVKAHHPEIIIRGVDPSGSPPFP